MWSMVIGVKRATPLVLRQQLAHSRLACLPSSKERQNLQGNRFEQIGIGSIEGSNCPPGTEEMRWMRQAVYENFKCNCRVKGKDEFLENLRALKKTVTSVWKDLLP